jgi:DNA-binding transcriptional ArsR family regulator
MVESRYDLNLVFRALGDPVRRDILRDLSRKPRTVSEIAAQFSDISLAGVSKHIKVLERARLVRNERRARFRYVSLNPAALQSAEQWLAFYQKFWTGRLDSLRQFVEAKAGK